ncbi:polycystic kidney disease 2-like 2 protein [Stylophora pistillata]|nr:polycystic kidney disease 2-like 2 protein [Stylophora pistillata]
MRRQQAKKQNLTRYFTELVAYLVFVFLLMAVCYGNRNDHRYLMTKSIRDGLPSFSRVKNNTMYWNWLQKVYIPGVFSGRWYNGQEEKKTMYIGNKHSLLVGMARVRQLRVRSTQCKVPNYIEECFEGYSIENEDKATYNKPGWRPVENVTRNDELLRLCPRPWRYQHVDDTDTILRWGQFSYYHGGGFVADLGYQNHTGFRIVTDLQKNSWLDRKTRVVIAEFSTFNPSVNVLGVATYFYEVQTSGLKTASMQIHSLSIDSTDTSSNQFYSICTFLFIVSMLLYFGRESLRLYSHRSRYFKSIWNWIEIFQIFFSLFAVVTYMIRQSKVISTMGKVHKNIYANPSFQEAITCQEVENAFLGILIFIATTKLLRIIRFNNHVALISKTLKISARSLIWFSFVFLIFFVAFLHFGVLMFGCVSERYSSVLKGAYFQLELTLGRVKARPINELAEANTKYAKVFAFLILFTLSILWMNFFIGIIKDALSDAKNNVNENELYKLIDEDRCPTSEKRKEFFDAISKTLSQSRASQKSVEVKEKQSENVGLYSKNHSNLNFDLISQAIVASREKRSKGTMNKQQYRTRKQSLFDKISNMLKSLKGESNDECRKRTQKKKVRFQEDIVESSLCKLRRRKHDLLQRLERIVSGFSEEDEDFHYLLKTAEVRHFKG